MDEEDDTRRTAGQSCVPTLVPGWRIVLKWCNLTSDSDSFLSLVFAFTTNSRCLLEIRIFWRRSADAAIQNLRRKPDFILKVPCMSTPKYHGIIPPLVTPLLDRDTLDEDGLQRLIEHEIQGGVHGLFILGTTGESPSLSYRLRRVMISRVCELVDGRVPILVGITDTAFVESVHLARHAADAGADSVVLAAPYYFPAGQTELIGYLKNLIAELPIPLVLYNMPALTKIWFEVDTVKQMAEIDKIIGIKDSSGDLDYFGNLLEIRKSRPDWSFMIGQESLLPKAIEMGGHGAVAGGANVFPKLFVETYLAAVNRQSDRLSQLSELVEEFQRIYEIGKYGSRFIKATKCSLSILNICSDFMAEPFHRFHPEDRDKVSAILQPLQQKLEKIL